VDGSYWLITVGSIAMLAGSIALQIRTYSRRRPVRPNVIILGQAVAFGSMVLFSVVLSRPPGVLEWALILTAGVLCGAAYAGLIRIEQTPAGIVMSYTLPWLLVWGALLMLTQGAAAITGRLPWVIYSLAIFAMTLNLGMNGRVVARYRALRIGGVAAAILLAPLLASALALAPMAARPALATDCSVSQIPSIFRGLLPPGGIVPFAGDEADALRFWSATDSSQQRPIVYVVYNNDEGQTTTEVIIEVFRSADAETGGAQEIAYWTGISPSKTWTAIGAGGAVTSSNKLDWGVRREYLGVAGPAFIHVTQDVTSQDPGVLSVNTAEGLFASIMDGATGLDPNAVFALAAADSCAFVPTGTAEPGPAGSTAPGATTQPGGTTGQPGGTSAGRSGLDALFDGEPIQPGDLTQGLLLANGLLILGSLMQLLAGSAGSSGWTGGATSGPGGATPGPGGSRANGTPFGDGRVWYQAPWDVGGPVPMTPAEVADIENKQRQGLIWSKTDGWVTPQQGAEYQATRAHQLEVERAESDRAAAESHRAIQAARDAQEAARQKMRNLDRTAEIATEMRESERQHALDMAELARVNRIANTLDVAVEAGDLAATALGIVGGPLGIKVRAGYRVLTGTAEGLGRSFADGASIGETVKRVTVGTVEGGIVAGMEMGIDGATRKMLGLPPMFPPKPPPIPPSLLVPRAIMRQALGDAAEIAKKKGVDAAARTVDPAKVLRLFEKGGMETLGQLEQAGAVTASEAQVIRKVLSNQVNVCVKAGTGEAAWEFAARTGVRVQEVLVADSGSSAAGAAGSLISDADRTYLGLFHPEDLADYARQHGISPAEAASRLNRELTSAADEKVAEQLGLRKLTPKDVGYTGYSGFGETAGPADSYAGGFTRVRTATQGKTLVVRPDGTTYLAGKDAILDAEGLAAMAQGGTMPPAQPTVPFSEFGQLGNRQVEALVAHTDPKSVAKAMDRVGHLAGRTGIAVDSTAAGAAKAIRGQPQSVGEILAAFGLTPDEFRTRALDTSMRFMTKLASFGK
jgi:hypothetical protein